MIKSEKERIHKIFLDAKEVAQEYKNTLKDIKMFKEIVKSISLIYEQIPFDEAEFKIEALGRLNIAERKLHIAVMKEIELKELFLKKVGHD